MRYRVGIWKFSKTKTVRFLSQEKLAFYHRLALSLRTANINDQVTVLSLYRSRYRMWVYPWLCSCLILTCCALQLRHFSKKTRKTSSCYMWSTTQNKVRATTKTQILCHTSINVLLAHAHCFPLIACWWLPGRAGLWPRSQICHLCVCLLQGPLDTHHSLCNPLLHELCLQQQPPGPHLHSWCLDKTTPSAHATVCD